MRSRRGPPTSTAAMRSRRWRTRSPTAPRRHEVEQLADAFLASEAVIQIAESPKGERFTTRRIWELEREALAAVERMRADGPAPAGELVAARVIHARPTLKADQAEMVRRLLTSPEGVAVVIGEAGTGKTYRDRRRGARAGRRRGSSCAPRRRPGARRTCCATRACRRRSSPACWSSSTAPSTRAAMAWGRDRCC